MLARRACGGSIGGAGVDKLLRLFRPTSLGEHAGETVVTCGLMDFATIERRCYGKATIAEYFTYRALVMDIPLQIKLEEFWRSQQR